MYWLINIIISFNQYYKNKSMKVISSIAFLFSQLLIAVSNKLLQAVSISILSTWIAIASKISL